MIDAAELIDNTFLRQFQMDVEGELATIEYSLKTEKFS